MHPIWWGESKPQGLNKKKNPFTLRAMKVLGLDLPRKCIVRARKFSFKTTDISMVNKELNCCLWIAFKINLWIFVVNYRIPKDIDTAPFHCRSRWNLLAGFIGVIRPATENISLYTLLRKNFKISYTLTPRTVISEVN